MLGTFCRRSLLLLSLLTSGCAMCVGTDDYAYSAYGGRWQRDNMLEGRAGSAFAPSGGVTIDDAWLPVEEAPLEEAPAEVIPSEAAPAEAKPPQPPRDDAGSAGTQEKRSILR